LSAKHQDSDMTPQTASGIDIFVVDDECLIAHTLGIILSQVGYCVSVFDDPITARLHLHDFPRLLITDHHMPGLTGSDLASIFADEAPSTKVLLLSANLLPPDAVWQMVEKNLCDARLVAKPISPSCLLSHVGEMIGPPSGRMIYPKSGDLRTSMTPGCNHYLHELRRSPLSSFGPFAES
jgi:DNA-binding NtrC family response regulator